MTNDPGVRRRRNPALPGGVGTLARALIRISASPDLDAVLQEVVDSARAFTGARCGMITTVGERGRPDGFFSSGLTPDEHRLLAEWDDGPRVFEHLRDRPQPLRVADVPGYVRSLGFSAPVLPGNTLRGTPIRYRDVHLGDLVCHRGGGRAGVRGRRRGDAGAVRVAGGEGDRQRPCLPGRDNVRDANWRWRSSECGPDTSRS